MDHHNPASNNNNNNSNNDKARRWAQSVAQSAAHTMQELTARKYTLPDKNVASQLLMYRQLLHTKCRPGLKLSREYQATPAQQAVKHMPWWAEGCEETKKMVISYDNLIRRLWLHGAIYPHHGSGTNTDDDSAATDIDTLLNEEGNPPIPHENWVSRLGFQQTDPVTDFRSGGVLSLAMMVHVAESCPDLFKRFVGPDGEASVLPFAITSINITDMMAKFLMLTKTVDRMDALMSQKPFWRMFANPDALTACQEVSLDMLADVVVELTTERQLSINPDGTASNNNSKVTVFDFSTILERTEKRVQYDLLGAGPKTVEELYQIRARVKQKYKQQLADLIKENQAQVSQKQQQQQGQQTETTTNNDATTTTPSDQHSSAVMADMAGTAKAVGDTVLRRASGLASGATSLASGATSLAGNVFQKIKLPAVSAPGFLPLSKQQQQQQAEAAATVDTETVDFSAAEKEDDSGKKQQQQEETATAATPVGVASAASSVPAADDDNNNNNDTVTGDEDWAGTDLQPATDAVRNFTIGGEEEEEEEDGEDVAL